MEKKAALSREELERRERKYGNSLVVSGSGVIIFGVWSVLKIFEEIIIGDVEFFDLVTAGNADVPKLRAIMPVVFAIIIMAVLFIHYRVGRAAILVGREKKKKFLYLIIAALMFFSTVADFGRFFASEVELIRQDDTTIAAFFVDVAFCFALFDMFVSSILIWNTRRKLGRM